MMIKRHLIRAVPAVAIGLALAACNVSLPNPNASPTPEPINSPTIEDIPTAAATTTSAPRRTQPPVPVLESPTPSPTPGPPTATYTPTETPGPFEHTMRQNETLYYIIQLYGYTDLAVIDQIVAMNPNIPNPDRLPGEGAVILIPRPTATPTPEGWTPSPTPLNAVDTLPAETTIMEHRVRPGETIVGIAGQYETTLAILDGLNPELRFFNCDFSNPSGGPDCNVPLSVDQIVKVPAPTPTPTLSPTPSGSETPTPTPTYAAPMLIFPPEGAVAQGGTINLQWLSIGQLPPEQYYLVEVEDTTTGAQLHRVTRDTSYRIGEEIAPKDGQTHAMRWRVRIGVYTEGDLFRPISAEGPWRTFQWR
ncbi:MAG: LysM peptidoglycan-binding domain-containing protein [Chloroflexota bacterium]